ncbi:ABC transporter permease [Flindersiella endophytica]
MGGLWLTLRAVLWGKGLSLALLVVAVGGVAAAVGTSIYAASVQEAMLSERLAQTSDAAARLSITDVDSAQAVRKVADPELTRYFAPPVRGIESRTVKLTISETQEARTVAAWRENQCEHVVMVRGTCPTAGDGIAVLAADGKQFGIKLGFVLNDPRYPEPLGKVVGWYQPKDPKDPYWGDRSYFERRREIQVPPTPPRIGSPLLSEEQARRLLAIPVTDWMLQRDKVHIGDLSVLTAKLTALSQAPRVDNTRYKADLVPVLDTFEKERILVERAGLLVVLQILLLSWYLLYLMVQAFSEAREAQFALAKLRGHRLRSTLVFGVSLPVLVLVAAVPIGAVLGWAAVNALRGQLLPPGTEVTLGWPTFAALAITAVGGLAAIVLASWRLARDPVAEQLRGGTRVRRRIAVFVVGAVLVTLAAAGIYQLRSLGDTVTASGLGLLTPALIAMAAGILGTQLVMLLARSWIGLSRARRGVAGWLAARQLARRRGNGRVVILLVTSGVLVLFGANALLTGMETRRSQAYFELSAPVVRDVQLNLRSPAELMAAVRQADPAGRYAMTVVENTPSDSRGGDRLLAVDSSRLANVAAWAPGWGPSPLADLAKRLREPAQSSVLFKGNLIELTVDTAKLKSAEPVSLRFEAETTGGSKPGSKLVGDLGKLRPGVRTYRAELPSCQVGCRLRKLTMERLTPVALDARLVFRELRVDGKPVDAGFTAGADRWRSALALSGMQSQPPRAVVVPAGKAGAAARQGLVADLHVGQSAQELGLTPRDLPAVLPVVRASTTQLEQFYGAEKSALERYDGIERPAGGLLAGRGVDSAGRPVRSAGQAELLPRLGREGVLMDLEYAEREAQPLPFGAKAEVWMTADAPASILRTLEAEGFLIGPERSIEARLDQLDGSGAAIAQTVFLVASIAAFGLALSGTVLLLVISARRRRYEVAALSVAGVSPRSVRWAEAAEAITLFWAAGLLMFGCAYLSTPLISVAAPNAVSALFGPRAPGQPWAQLGGLTAGMTLVLFGIGWLVAVWLIRTSRPEVLREARP